MSNQRQYVLFLCNDSNLEKKLHEMSTNYTSRFIIFINPTDEQVTEAMSNKNVKIVQVFDVKNNDKSIKFRKNIAPNIIISITENFGYDKLAKVVFEGERH